MLKGKVCIKNMTDYEILAPEALQDTYAVQKLGEKYLLIMKRELPYPRDFGVMSVKDITSTWEEGREQVWGYISVFTFVFAVSMVIVAAVTRHILRALEELQAQAERIQGGDFNSKVTLTARDELKELSDSLNRMSDQIRQQIEDLELLLGAMAHEMKTPLTSIMGYADSLLHVRLSDRQREQSLEAIYRSAGRLNEMSGKLMQLIGLYENQEIESRQVDLVQVLESIREENREKLKEETISFHIVQKDGSKIQGTSTMMVEGDRLLLTSLFGNLISNSIKELDCFGEILVALDSQTRIVCVEDSGRGIPVEDLPHVTKAFYMVDRSRSRRQQGAGLGLALAERIVRAHGGAMEIESCLGKGTKVIVKFPKKSEDTEVFTN